MADNFDYKNIDGIFESRIRLAVLSILATSEKVEFAFLKKQLKATDGNLGAHLKKLEDVKYVRCEKKFFKRKPVSFYSLTETGRKAIINYLSMVENLFSKTE